MLGLYVDDSTFLENFSQEHLSTLRLSAANFTNSTFINNYSKQGTHGFLIDTNSEVTFKNITIRNDEATVRKIMHKDIQVTSGFFIVNGQSTLQIESNSTIENTFGRDATLAVIQSGSEVYFN